MIKLQHVRAMARKEWWHLLRDSRSLALILLMPTMLLFLFGYAIRLDITDAPIGILQEHQDLASNELASRFEASHAFHVVRYFQDRSELRNAIQDGSVWGALVIPHDYSNALDAGTASVQLILDGVDADSARLVRNYALALINNYSANTLGRAPQLQVDDRLWFNESRESRMAILPGVIAIVMAVIGALLTSLTIAREMEAGNLVMLRTAPLSRGEFLLGKLFPYFVIGMGDLIVAATVVVYIFDVPLRGSVVALAFISALFLLVVMLQGALISVVAGSQLLASQIALVSTFLPAFLLSGFIFAIENMPTVLHYLTLIVPARYYVALSKAIFLKGVGPLLLWSSAAALMVMVVVLATALRSRASKLGLLP